MINSKVEDICQWMNKYRRDIIQNWDKLDYNDIVDVYEKGISKHVGEFKNGDFLVYKDKENEEITGFVVFRNFCGMNDTYDYIFSTYFSFNRGVSSRNHRFIYTEDLQLASEEEKLIFLQKIADNGIF